MKIKLKQYERALKVVEQAREQLKIVKTWDEAVKQVGDLGNQQIVAITVNEDGSIRTECELVHRRRDSESAQSQPK